MEWEKASTELGITLSQYLAGFDCRKKPMFGALVYFVNDNMFTGIKGNGAFLRLSEDDRRGIMAECDEVQPFEPRPALFMKEYVEIPASKLDDQDFMLRWLRVSYAFVSSLPPKSKKKKTSPKPGHRDF